jgi:dUTP pyrophosphatase
MRRNVRMYPESPIRGFEVVKDEHKQNKKLVVDPFTQLPVEVYAPINLPARATRRSAGYDFYLPQDVTLLPAQKTVIWTDVKAYMQEDEVLELYPRSSLGIKQGIMFSNTVGIIDSDYYQNVGNDGNIGLALLNTSGRGVELKAGERIAQGIFKKFLRADVDTVITEERVGGTGSTGE